MVPPALKAECLRRGLWREEGNYVRRGPFPPAAPEVAIRELSTPDDNDGFTYLKIEPLHAPAVVFETGNSDPTVASSPVQTPARFAATGMRYRFLAFDPADLARVSVVKEWTAKVRLKHQLHNRGDHYELELMALPNANGISIHYTLDGSAPIHVGAAQYDGFIRIPPACRVVCAVAVAQEYDVNSAQISIAIPQRGQEERTLDKAIPARWNQTTKLDDTASVWDLIQKLQTTSGVKAQDISFTAESADRQQNLDFTGTVEGGYDGNALHSIATRLQDIVGGGNLRMTLGSLGFITGQGLLDWLKVTNQPFIPSKAVQ